jgi:hypothetical protein
MQDADAGLEAEGAVDERVHKNKLELAISCRTPNSARGARRCTRRTR